LVTTQFSRSAQEFRNWYTLVVAAEMDVRILNSMLPPLLLLLVSGASAAPTLPVAVSDSAQRSSLVGQVVLGLDSSSAPVEGSISRQNSEESDLVSHGRSRSIQRKTLASSDRSPSTDRYPSPHGKNSRWRFNLRYTLDPDVGPTDVPIQNSQSSHLHDVKRSPSANSI
jgi:hypothetical protein